MQVAPCPSLCSCPFLVKHLTGCIPVIGGALFVFVVITLLQTSFSDPGILPRATPDEAADIEKQIGMNQTSRYFVFRISAKSLGPFFFFSVFFPSGIIQFGCNNLKSFQVITAFSSRQAAVNIENRFILFNISHVTAKMQT